MVELSQFKQVCDDLKAKTPEIDSQVLVSHEGHLINKLKDRQGIVMAAVYPSFGLTGRVDRMKSKTDLYFFVLEKDDSGQSDEDEFLQYQKLLAITVKLKDYFAEEAGQCSLFQSFEPSSVNIEPEYREFGGWNGWSFTISF